MIGSALGCGVRSWPPPRPALRSGAPSSPRAGVISGEVQAGGYAQGLAAAYTSRKAALSLTGRTGPAQLTLGERRSQGLSSDFLAGFNLGRARGQHASRCTAPRGGWGRPRQSWLRRLGSALEEAAAAPPAPSSAARARATPAGEDQRHYSSQWREDWSKKNRRPWTGSAPTAAALRPHRPAAKASPALGGCGGGCSAGVVFRGRW